MNPNLITPAMLNFMQSEQQPANQMELLNESPQMQPNTQINENNDPFNSGIRRAIDTARESLGMTEKQQDKSLRRGLLNFAANIAQTPKQKGFFNNWGAASRAAIPALMEYDNAESQYEAQNNAMAQQIQKERKALRDEAFEREKFRWHKQFQGDQLAETKRHHGLKSDKSKTGSKSAELNEKKFNKRIEEVEDKSLLNDAYQQYIDNITDAKAQGLTGKTPLAQMKRYWASKTGQSENMDIEEMLRISHANRVKELGGSNANQKQFEVAMLSAPSITKDPDATITFLKKIIKKNDDFLRETDHLANVWGDDYEGQEYAILKQYRGEQKKKNKNAVGDAVDVGDSGQRELGNQELKPGYEYMIDPDNNEIVQMPKTNVEQAIAEGGYKRL